MLKKVRKGLHKMTSALNSESDNSVLGATGREKVPADGTGKSCRIAPKTRLNSIGVVQLDPWLSPFKDALRARYSHAQKWMKTLDDTEGGLNNFSKGFEKFGFVVHEHGDITYREWAPNALRAYLIGDFSETLR